MSDIMRPIPFESLVDRVFSEAKQGSIFSILKENFYKDNLNRVAYIFGKKCSTVLGPAAGPHTQLCQNIIASFLTGSRFIELKTVQIMDTLEIAKPCIDARDEGYNVEWSTEYTLTKARDEYYKAWILCNLLYFLINKGYSKPHFVFNMSVGYNLEGIKNPRMQEFIDGMMDASKDVKFNSYLNYIDKLLEDPSYFDGTGFEEGAKILHESGLFSKNVYSSICKNVTISTMHGCPPTEIEAICNYMLTEKHIDTYVKLNPTLLGYDKVREILDKTGYGYVKLKQESFEKDLQYGDAIPMLKRLELLASQEHRKFGIKLTNTLGNVNNKGKMPGDEMYMSGRSLFPISTALAAKISKEFDGRLPISYSGGANIFNIEKLFKTGIRPITIATDMLHPGGYNRMTEIAKKLDTLADSYFTANAIDTDAVEKLSREALDATYTVKETRGTKRVSSKKETLDVFDCFSAPCESVCPVGQSVADYIKLAAYGPSGAVEAIRELYKYNALPNITCEICDHKCQSNCTRLDVDFKSVQIRDMKKYSVENGFGSYTELIKTQAIKENGKKVAVVGAGPSGLAAAIFLRQYGYAVDVYEKNNRAGGVVEYIIPSFRISDSAINRDFEMAKLLGVNFHFNVAYDWAKLETLKSLGFERIFYCIGAEKETEVKGFGDSSRIYTALDFLSNFKENRQSIALGKHVVIIGGGNTAMDAARAAKRVADVETVTVLYRKTRVDMPADKEEFDEAYEEGVDFIFLGYPKELREKTLRYVKMEIAGKDAKGRNATFATKETEVIPCSSIIAAIGQGIDTATLKMLGLHVSENNRPIVDRNTFETDQAGVFLIGDCAHGASTVINCVSSARKAVDYLAEGDKVSIQFSRDRVKRIQDEKSYIKYLRASHADVCGHVDPSAPSANETMAQACLDCKFYCGKCVDVCPNRANVAIDISKDRALFKDAYQIVHIDAYCNECGNCAAFCPHEKGRPYKDKFTVFTSFEDLTSSVNDGFYVKGNKAYIRQDARAYILPIVNGVVSAPEILPSYRALIKTICNDYSYLLNPMGE